MADLSQVRVRGTLYDIKDATARMAFGAPAVAATASAMTDQTKVYVYTGSESGYTNGSWYYYDGSSWVAGGVYNSTAVATDTSLSVSGKPADAAATGSALDDIDTEISDLKSALDNAKVTIEYTGDVFELALSGEGGGGVQPTEIIAEINAI